MPAADRPSNNGSQGDTQFVQFIPVIFLMIAIPGFVQSTTRVNEAKTVVTLRAYAAAQARFLERRGEIAPDAAFSGTGYCDNFRNLYYARDRKGEQLRYIAKAQADAFGSPASKTPTMEPAAGMSKPLAGYIFIDDPYVAENELWETEFGLFAIPVQPGKTGDLIFWAGKGNRIRWLGLPRNAEMPTVRPEDSPLHPEIGNMWSAVD